MQLNKIGIIYPPQACAVWNKEAELNKLRQAAPDAEIIYSTTIDELCDLTDDVDALFLMPILDREGKEKLVNFCKNAKSLKWVHSLIAGVDSFISTDIGKMDILITSTKGMQALPMGDTVLAFVYSWLRNFPMMIRAQSEHRWCSEAGLTCDEAEGKTIGFVGYGNLGSQIARKFKLLGFRVVCAKRSLVTDDVLDACYTMEQLDEMLPLCDFVVLICPLTEQTYHLINPHTLSMMKKTAFLINIARGAVIDDEALVKALKDRQIGGAGLDIFVEEPLQPDNPYFALDNVILSHHTSPMTPHIAVRTFNIAADQIRRYIADEKMLFIAEKP